ncbi:MAG: hypothetical protein R8P61_26255 [Bacteroidia bacterium]|nr:hypothetical protein [Bacteroidia bacterium]
MSDQNTSHFFPLETLLLRLEREGFTFGIDQHLRLQKVLKELGKDYLKEPEKLRNILAPILVFTQDGTRTFDRVFDEYIQLVVKPSVNQRLFNIEDPHLQDGHIQVDPRVRWLTSISRWILSWVGVVVLLLSVGIFLLLPNLERFFGWDQNPLQPNFSISNINQAPEMEFNDTVFVGDTIVFRNTSSLLSVRGQGMKSLDLQREIQQFLWKINLGDSLIVDSLQTKESKEFRYVFFQEGTYLVSLSNIDGVGGNMPEEIRSIKVVCSAEKKVQLSKLNIRPKHSSNSAQIINKKINFSLGIPPDWEEYEVNWSVNGTKLREPSYTFRNRGTYIISAEAFLKDKPSDLCKKIDTTFQLTLIPEEKSIFFLNPASMSLDPAGDKEYGLSLWVRFMPIFLALGLVFLIDKFRLRRKRKKLLQTYNLDRGSISEGPVEIPFPELDHLISHDPKVFSLANAMRQRSLGDRQKFDIKTTIRDTARSLGLVNLRFLQTSKASEYVIFIEQIHPQSHTARLFSRLVQMLKGEDVVLEVFYFDRDMRICWNEDFAEGIRIEQIQQKYRGHRLLIYSDGENLIDPYEAKIKDWVKTQLSVWKGKSAIITPKLVADWGYKEKCLSEYFYLLSAELGAQQLLPELFTNEEIEGYESYLKLSEEYAPNPQESLRDYDFNQLEDLRLFLGDSHFELLAACMVYPLPSWEVSLSMAKTLSIRTGNEYLQTYDTFLRLARIPWMQTGLVSPGLRRELLATLKPETEHLARKTILELLDQVGVKEDSLAGRKLAIQQISNKFLTEPGDEEIARKMYVLWRKNEILDPVVEERLHKKSAQLRGESSDKYLQTRFEVITPMRTLLKALLLGFLVAIGTYKLDKIFSGSHLLKDFSYKYGLNGILTERLKTLDDASYMNNRGVEAFKRGDMLQARKDFYSAMQFRHHDLLEFLGREISLEEASRIPYWPIDIKVEGEEERKLDFGIYMDERLANLDSIKSVEEFDDALLMSFDRSQIYLGGEEYIDDFELVGFKEAKGKEGLIPAFLFNYSYPIAGRNLLAMISYNRGIEAFNQSQFSLAKDNLSLAYSLLSTDLRKANLDIFQPLFLEVAHAYGFSKLLTGDEDAAKNINKTILKYDPAYYDNNPPTEKDLKGVLEDEELVSSLLHFLSNLKKDESSQLSLSQEKIEFWRSNKDGLRVKQGAREINLSEPLNIIAHKITSDSLRYLGTTTLADPAGIMHRVIAELKKPAWFPNKEFPDSTEDREIGEIAKWYCERGQLVMIDDPLSASKYIKPGVLMFFGGKGEDLRDMSRTKLFRRRGLTQLGVVCSVEKDEQGNVISYGLFHAQRPGMIAKITYQSRDNEGGDHLAYGYLNSQCLALAPIIPLEDSAYTDNNTNDCGK